MPKVVRPEGCPDKVKEALKKAVKMAESLESYRKIGTPEEITKVLENVNQFVEKYGTFEEVAKKLDALAEFEEKVGTLDRTRDFLERLLEAAMEEKAEEIAEGYGISVEKAKELLEEFESPAKVESLLSELYEARERDHALPEGEEDEEAVEESDEEAPETEGEKVEEAKEAKSEKDEFDIIEDEEFRRARLVLEEAKKPLDENYLTESVTRRLLQEF